MSNGNLTDLQCQVLKTLAQLKGSWRLSGGGALIGAYTHQRNTLKFGSLSGLPKLKSIEENIYFNDTCTSF